MQLAHVANPVELNLATLIERIGAAVSERPAIIERRATITFAEFVDRSRRLASLLAERGFGCYRERSELRGHEVGQSLMGQYLYNGSEYLEGMIGAYRARVAPFNINYRYVADELAYLLNDARPQILQYHAQFAPALGEALAMTDLRPLLLQVADDSGHDLLPTALDYHDTLAATKPIALAAPSADDLYVLYTGGTTGMPKGVLWRQADVAVTTMGLIDRRNGEEWRSVEDAVETARRRSPGRTLLCAPLIHGASQWGAMQTLGRGGTIVIPDNVKTFDAADVWDTVACDDVTQMAIVGEAFAAPLADEIERRPRDVASLRYLVSGGAALRPETRARILAAVPNLTVLETIGSSETGIQGSSMVSVSSPQQKSEFTPDSRTRVVSQDFTHFLQPGHDGTGWLASAGRIPLGYLGDEAKTASSYPEIEGIRLSVPGDRARVTATGSIELLGRDSTTVNSGGEKIFVEEVENAVRDHPDVTDAVVCGRPSQRWGSEVVAIVAVRGDHHDIEQDIINTASRRIARYKLPKAVVVVDRIERGPAGKPDYRWALEIAAQSHRQP
ncbi:AMP-binding protein [Mycolicibacterium sp. XJ1819]